MYSCENKIINYNELRNLLGGKMSQLLFSLYLQVTYITKLSSVNVWSFSLQQGCQDHSTEKGQSLQQMVLGKLDYHI